MPEPSLLLHAGAGSFRNVARDPSRRGPLLAEIERIATLQWQRLAAGAPALDVVEAAVRDLEDCPLYNAGTGSVLTQEGVVEMDAAIMDGRDRRCGAVGAVRRVRHPIALARAVLDESPHVLLVGEGADRFGREHGLEPIDPAALITPERREALTRAITTERPGALTRALPADGEQGTVGAVARDGDGHLAAATSTGGTTAGWPGRLGDSPIIGAGTWADDRTTAVSATGFGEVFIRAAFAHTVAAGVAGGVSLAEACQAALAEVKSLGGDGGCIAVSAGEQVADFNSPGMLRAWIDAGGRVRSAILP